VAILFDTTANQEEVRAVSQSFDQIKSSATVIKNAAATLLAIRAKWASEGRTDSVAGIDSAGAPALPLVQAATTYLG
jgi:hypothetical protein